MRKDAVIEGPYRYWLMREWNPSLPRLCSFMLNPSTADAQDDDPTLLRNIHFATLWGYGGLEVVNPYAFRTPHPSALLKAMAGGADVVGERNLEYVTYAFHSCHRVVVAWGAAPWAQAHAQAYLNRFRHLSFWCFGLTKDKAPKHPLARGKERVPNDAQPQLFLPRMEQFNERERAAS